MLDIDEAVSVLQGKFVSKDEELKKYCQIDIVHSDAEGMDFYYMGQFDIVHIEKGEKKDKSGRMKDISKVEFKMHDLVREDLLNYLKINTQSGETNEDN